MDDPVVPYAHSVPEASTTQGESIRIPAGAVVDVRLPGDAMVAWAECVGQSGTLKSEAMMIRISPTEMSRRRVGECFMGDNSPLHSFSCTKLSTATGNFVLEGV